MPIELTSPSLEESLDPMESVVSIPLVEANATIAPTEGSSTDSDPIGMEIIITLIGLFVLYGLIRLLIGMLPYIFGLAFLGLLGFLLIR